MLLETYLKEYYDFEDDNSVYLVSFEGDKNSINRLRECAKEINGCEINGCDEKNVEPAEEAKIEKDMINHPSHYTDDNGMECIDEMMLVFGKEAVAHFCLCNVWKYRHRAVYKNGVEDKLKSDWYMAKYEELKEQIKKESTSYATTITWPNQTDIALLNK